MNKKILSRKLFVSLGSFLGAGAVLVLYFKAPLLPVLIGGLIALAVTLPPYLKEK